MNLAGQKKTIAFIGAGGIVAEKSIPILAERYNIIGVGGRRRNLSSYCAAFHSVNLFSEFSSIFSILFSDTVFDAIVWNPVTYVPRTLLGSTRETLHSEFDIAIALPLECLRMGMEQGALAPAAPFIMTSSQLAFRYKPRWASYSIVKRGQLMLTEYLAQEVGEAVIPRCILFGGVPETDSNVCADVFTDAIEDRDREKRLYHVDTNAWRTIPFPR